MMLTALYEYAKSRGLLEDTGYQRRRIDFVLQLSEAGELLGLVPAAELVLSTPRAAQRSSNIAASFLIDTATYVLGIPEASKEKLSKKQAKKREEDALARQAAFQKLVEDALAVQPDPHLSAFLTFERNIEIYRPRILDLHPASSWLGKKTIATQVAGAWIHERPAVRAAWHSMRSAASGPDSDALSARCLVSGLVGPAAKTHPDITRVPGMSNAGPLISFNRPAFGSLGLQQAENAPVSRDAAEGYAIGLNSLLQKDPSKTRPYASGMKLGPDNVVLVWTQKPSPEVSSLLDLLEERTSEDAIEDLSAPWTGRLAPSADDDSEFYAVTLGGKARVVVRDWFQTRFGEAKTNVRSWFQDLELVGVSRPPAIWQLLQALDPPGNASVPPSLAAALGHSALFGGRVPLELMRHALMRLRIPPKPKEKFALQQRIALIKLTLIRTLNQEVSVALDEEKRDVPYLLGRLFAVLERLQGAALGDVNATIRDRYFGAASSTPAVVFPRLLRLSVHHASKSGADWLEKIKGSVMGLLPAEQFPQILSLEDQGLFAVGYYQQREKFFEKRSNPSHNGSKETE